MIVSFSGIDSSGKTTQLKLLVKYCDENDIKCRWIWGKARGTPGVEYLKKIFRRDKYMTIDKKMEYRELFYKSSIKRKILLTISLLDLCWYFGIYYNILKYKYQILILDRFVWDTYI